MTTDYINKHKFILFVGDHFNPLGMVRSLGEYGIKSDVVLIASNPIFVNHSKYVNSIKIFKSSLEGLNYLIETFSGEIYKPFILTGSDDLISMIDSHYTQLKNNFIFFNAGRQNGINELLSKRVQNELAISCGLNVPPFEEVQVGECPSHIKYPIITKAIDSTCYNWKNQVYLCHNEAELLEAYKKLRCEKILLQEYIEKENETGFDALSINHGQDVYLPLQLSYHSVDETSFGHSIYFFKPNDKELLIQIRELIRKTGYEGIFSIDFLKGRNGKLYFLEINFRNSAWSYPMTKAGVNLPIIWAKSMVSSHMACGDVRIENLPFTAIVETAEFIQGFRRGLKSGFQSLKKIMNSDSVIIWNSLDSKPFFYFFLSRIKATLRSLLF